MRDHTGRRPIPVEQSILWKPLRDPHYVVASLQPGDGGRRKVFVRQQVLGRLHAVVRAHGPETVGLTAGQFYQCPVTGTEYLVIESLVELGTVGREDEIAACIGEALVDRSSERRGRVVGWYRGVATVDPKPSAATASVHTELFDQPWHTTLVVTDTSRGSNGAFFLRDTTNMRWFHAPFYELPDHAPAPNEAKPSVVRWPDYMTTDSVLFDERLIIGAASNDTRLKREPSNATSSADRNADLRPGTVVADLPLILSETSEPIERRVSPLLESLAQEPFNDTPLRADRPAAPAAHEGLADVSMPVTARQFTRRNSRPMTVDKLGIVDDSDQTAVISSGRVVTEADDTTADDDPAWYIELARSEGFFIAAKFQSVIETNSDEVLWVLNEPYSGMLLAVVTTRTAVVEATLHYNRQTDDAGLSRVPFPAHRDAESKTIYARESCVDGLRARCRRLRATNALLREWKVTPAISFLTSSEWESIPQLSAGIEHGLSEINSLNNARIAELPAGVRDQLHIGGGDVRA